MKGSLSKLWNKLSYGAQLVTLNAALILAGTGLMAAWGAAITPHDDPVAYTQEVEGHALAAAIGLTFGLTPFMLLNIRNRRREDEFDQMRVRMFQHKIDRMIAQDI